MKKKILLIGVCTLMMCGCGKEVPKLSDGSEAVVSFDNESLSISANELYEGMKERYALDVMIQLMDKKILESEYPNDLEDAKKEADTSVKSMVDTYGKDQINSYFGSVESYTEYMYINNLQQKAILDYAKGKVTDKEIQEYYDKNIYGDVTVDHILIKTDTDDEEKDKEAKNKINEIIDKLNKAENKLETFKELAKEYSEDDATKDNGGSLGAINTDTLSSSYDELLKSARALKDNTYSTEIITTELGYHVIYKEKTDEKPSLDDKKEDIKEELANQKLQYDSTMSITALQELRKKYGMKINDSSINDKYSNYIANSIASARQQDVEVTK